MVKLIFYLTQHIGNIVTTYNQYKTVNEMLFFWLVLRLQNPLYVCAFTAQLSLSSLWSKWSVGTCDQGPLYGSMQLLGSLVAYTRE